MSFVHRFGAFINCPMHYDENRPDARASRALAGAQICPRRIGHCGVIDGVFEPIEDADDGPQSMRFRCAAKLTPEAVAAITEQVRIRVLRWFARSGLIERDSAREMLAWANSGFSLDAAVCVAANDRAGLERLLRPYVRLLHVRFVHRCCRSQPKRRCPFLADSGQSGDSWPNPDV